MLTANECRTMANTCTKWAAESEAVEARKAFLALARDWQYAAIVADKYAEDHDGLGSSFESRTLPNVEPHVGHR
jgi:hypothetical protein